MNTLPPRALTLWQPWAWLVASGHKGIENRPPGFSFKSFRGDFWIHAGAGSNEGALEDAWLSARGLCDELLGEAFVLPVLPDLVFGSIIGRATITGILEPTGTMFHKPGVPWHFPDQYGFVVENARALATPVPCRGYQGFWSVPPFALAELSKAVT